MAAPPLSRELAQQAVDAVAAHGNQIAAAAALDVTRGALQGRLRSAARYDIHAAPRAVPAEGFEITRETLVLGPDGAIKSRSLRTSPERGPEYELPAGHIVKGESALVDAEGRVTAKWVKTRLGNDPVDVAEVLKKAFEGYKPAARRSKPPKTFSEDLLTLIPCNDWHIGMFAWERETDSNWDLKIAERVIGRGIEDAIARSPAGGAAIVLGGGDLTHADNNKNQTSKSSNQLDVDGRHQKVVETAGMLLSRAIDAALLRNDRVIVRNLKGNHDEETAPAIAWFLRAWYRNEPRVTVDLDQSLFFHHTFGKVMLSATHGHEAKLQDMPGIMAHRRAADWGATKFRYAHGFHVHHKSKMATEGGGVVMESHQAPIPQDAWHFGSGFLSGRSLQTISYHRDFGEVSRVRVAILDAEAA